MKQTMKRTLALLMALLLALPSFALSEDYAPAVEDAAEELEVMLDDLDAGDDEADDAIEDVDAEGTVPAGYVRVRLAVTPEDAAVAVLDLATGEAIEPQADGGWLLVPGVYAYSAFAEGCAPVEEEPFEVPEGGENFELEIALEPAEEVSEESAEEATEEPAEEITEEATEEPAEEIAEETAEETNEEPVEEPAEETTEETIEEPTEEITEEPAEEPTEEPVEEPAEETAEEPAEEMTEEPIEAAAEEQIVEEEPEALEAVEAVDAMEAAVRVIVAVRPEDAAVEIRPADSDEALSPEEDGAWLLIPGEYVYSAYAEGCEAVEDVPFAVPEGDADFALEIELAPLAVAFEQTLVVDDVAVTVAAEPGAFPADAALSVEKVPVVRQAEADAAVDEVRGDEKNVAVSYTFDIRVLDARGVELQPAEGFNVSVSFALAHAADENLEASVYHITEDDAGELTAQALDAVEDTAEQTVTAETDGFSLYTVEFTYDSLQYVLQGGESVPLNTVLRAVGLAGEAESASVSNDELFSAAFEAGEWTLVSHRPFTTEEWLKVVIGGVEYEITVTDDIKFVSATCYVNGEAKTVQAVPVTEELTELNKDVSEWYVLNNNVTFDKDTRLKIQGDIHLILKSGYTLTAKKGVRLAQGNSLTVYSDAAANGTGALTASLTGNTGHAGIGGDIQESGGDFTLYGGVVTTTGATDAAGLGGGDGGCGGVVRIYGGTLTANGGRQGAGIGGGLSGSQGGAVTIWGGTVTAKGGACAAGIGGGENFADERGNEEFGGNGGVVNIWGGTVTATGGTYAAGIGGGQYGDGGTLRMGGQCTITATAGAKSKRDTNGIQAIGRGELSTNEERYGGPQTEGSVVFSGTAAVKAGQTAASAADMPAYRRLEGCRMPYAQIESSGSTAHPVSATINYVNEKYKPSIDVQDASGKSISQANAGEEFKVVITLDSCQVERLTATYTLEGEQQTLEPDGDEPEKVYDGNGVQTQEIYTFTMPFFVDDGVAVDAKVMGKQYNITVGTITTEGEESTTGGNVTILVNDSEYVQSHKAMEEDRVWISVSPYIGGDYFVQSLTVIGVTSGRRIAYLENDYFENMTKGTTEDLWSFWMPGEDVVVTANFKKGVGYIALNGKKKVQRYFTEITASSSDLNLNGLGVGGGWYVVRGTVNISNRVNVTADVNLILADGATLNAEDGIFVAKRTGGRLTVWAQYRGTGKISADATDTHWAGIGGNERDDGGRMTFNGGIIEAYGGTDASGIGTGDNGECDEIYINVPKGKPDGFTYVTAYGGKYGAGIGGGQDRNNKYTEINGGTVKAYGGRSGAGIGGGEGGGNEKIVINGGDVYAKGGAFGAGLGGGEVEYGGGFGGTVEIHGGKVEAVGGEHAAGIGAGEDGSGLTFTMTGGDVTATAGEGAAGVGGAKDKPGGTVSITGGKIVINADCNSAIGGGAGNGSNGSLSLGPNMTAWTSTSYSSDWVRSPGGSRVYNVQHKKYAWIQECDHDGKTYQTVDDETHYMEACQWCIMGGKYEPHVWGGKNNAVCSLCGLDLYRKIHVPNTDRIIVELFLGDKQIPVDVYEKNIVGGALKNSEITVKVTPREDYRLTGENAFIKYNTTETINVTRQPDEGDTQVYTFTMPAFAVVLNFGADFAHYVAQVNTCLVDDKGAVIDGNPVNRIRITGTNWGNYNFGTYTYTSKGAETLAMIVYPNSGYVVSKVEGFRRNADGSNGESHAVEKTSLNHYRFKLNDGDVNIVVTFKESKRGYVYHVLQQIDANGALSWPDEQDVQMLSKQAAGVYQVPRTPAYEVVPDGMGSWDYNIAGYRVGEYSSSGPAKVLEPGPVTDNETIYAGDITIEEDGEDLYIYFTLDEEPLRLYKKPYEEYWPEELDNPANYEELQLYVGMPVKAYLEKNNKQASNNGVTEDYVWALPKEVGKSTVILSNSVTMPSKGPLSLFPYKSASKVIVRLDLGAYDAQVNGYPGNEYWDEYDGDYPSYHSEEGKPWKAATMARLTDAQGEEIYGRAFVVKLGETLPEQILEAMYGAHRPGYKLEGWYTRKENVKWEREWGATEEYFNSSLQHNINGDKYYVITLKANWTVRDATVEFNPGAGSLKDGAVSSYVIKEGEYFTSMPKAIPPYGSQFRKWTDKNGDSVTTNTYYSSNFNNVTELVDTADPDATNTILLTAEYIPWGTVTSSIRFTDSEDTTAEDYASINIAIPADRENAVYRAVAKLQSGKWTTTMYDQQGNVVGTPFDLPDRGRQNFLGWSSTPNGTPQTSVEISSRRDIERDRPYAPDTKPSLLYARWSEPKYALTLNLDGGTLPQGISVQREYAVGETLPKDSAGETLSWADIAPVREGYDFLGWEPDVTQYSAMPAEDLAATAQWEQHKYSMFFVYGDKKEPYVIKAVAGADISALLPGEPVWEDDPETMQPDELGKAHLFGGWYPEDPVSVMPDEDRVYIAKWIEEPQKPDAPEVDGKTCTTLTVKAEAGQAYRLAGVNDWTKPTGDTLTFKGLTPGRTYSVETYIPAVEGKNLDSQVSDATVATLPNAVAVRLDVGGYNYAAQKSTTLRGDYWDADWPTYSTADGDVYFEENDASLKLSFMVDEGASIDAASLNVWREGHELDGWFAKGGEGQQWTEQSTASAEYFDDATRTATSAEGLEYTYHIITLKARWSLRDAIVVYEMNGGVKPVGMPETLAANGRITLTEPTCDKDGKLWDFVDWTDENGQHYKAGDALTYDSISLVSPVDRGGNVRDDEGKLEPNVIRLTANFALRPAVTVTVHFETDGGNAIPVDGGEEGPADFTVTIPAGEPTADFYISEEVDGFTLKSGEDSAAYYPISKQGHSFRDWYLDDEYRNIFANPMTIGRESAGETIHIYAKWAVVAFTIRFDTQGGNAIEPITQDYGTPVTRPADPVKEHHTFKGWAVEVDDDKLKPLDEFPATMPGYDLWLVADWEVNQYGVTLKYNDGQTADKVIQGDYNTSISYPDMPDRTAYAFDGWKLEDGEAYVSLPGKIPGEDQVYEAYWKANIPDAPVVEARTRDSLTVTAQAGQEYSLDGATWQTADAASLTFDGLTPGKEYTVSTRVAGKGKFDLPSDAATTTATTLSAVAVRLDMGTYDFVADIFSELRGEYWGGEWPDNSGDLMGWAYFPDEDLTVKRSFLVDEGAALPTAILDKMAGTWREGYALDGWYTRGNVKWENATAAVEQHFDSGRTGTATSAEGAEFTYNIITLKAQWSLRPASVVCDINDGVEPDGMPKTLNPGNKITFAEPTCDKDGKAWEFVNWTDAVGNAYAAGDELTYSDLSAIADDDVGMEPDEQGTLKNNVLRLTAHFKLVDADNGVLHFDSKGGNAVDDVVVPIAEGSLETKVTVSIDNGKTKVKYADQTVDFGNPTREHYTFKGWSDTSNSDEVLTNPFDITKDGKTLYAVWEVNKHSITFKNLGPDGKTTKEIANVPYGTALTDAYIKAGLPENATTWAHHAFKGWSGLVSTMPDADLTVTAQWETNKYTVTLNYNDGGATANRVITDAYGAPIETIADPTRPNCDFLGWQLDGAGDYVTLPTAIPGGDRTYVACWQAMKPAAPEVESRTRFTLTVKAIPGQMYRLGDGEWVEATGDTLTFNDLTPGETCQVTTLVPENAAQGYSASKESEATSVTLPRGVAVRLDAPDVHVERTEYLDEGEWPNGDTMNAMMGATRAGYRLNGWYIQNGTKWTINQTAEEALFDKADGENVREHVKEGEHEYDAYVITLKPRWTLLNANVTYKLANGSWPDGSTTDRSRTGIREGETITVTGDVPARPGYTFLHWKDENDGTHAPGTSFVYENLTCATPATTSDGSNTIVFTAVYEEKEAAEGTLTFDAQGGSAVEAVNVPIAKGVESAAVTVTSGDEKTTVTIGGTPSEFDNPTRAGHDFTGWSATAGGNPGAQALTFTRESLQQTLYAAWSVHMHTITVTDLGEAGGKKVIQVAYGTPLSNSLVINQLSEADLTREYHTFRGIDKTLSGNMPDEDLTVNAVWSPREYTLTFDTKGGSAIAPITASYGGPVAWPADPTREGYSFLGWKLNDALVTDDMRPATMPGENRTYEAQWQIGTFTLTFDTLGGTEIEAITAQFGAAIQAPADPTRLHFDFIGWQPELPATMPGRDLTVYALWKLHNYTVTFMDGGEEYAKVVGVYGSPVTAPDDPSREGEAFRGWSDAPDSRTIATLPETMPDADATYYAVWKEHLPAPEIESVDQDKTSLTVHMKQSPAEGDAYEFSLDGKTWQDAPVFTGLTEDTGYTVYARIKETEEHFASEAAEQATNTDKTLLTGASVEGEAVVGETLKASTEPEGAKDVGWQWTRDGKPIAGATKPTYTLTAADVGTVIGATAIQKVTFGDDVTRAAQTGPARKRPGEAAEAPVLKSRTSGSLTVETKDGEEYSIDGGKTWQTGDTFTGLDPVTEYSVVARRAETATTYAGPISEPLAATTDKAPGGAASAPVLKSRTSGSLTIETKDGEEYSIDGGKTWQTGDTFTGLDPAAEYSIVARRAETATTYAGPISQPLAATTDKLPQGPVEGLTSTPASSAASKNGAIQGVAPGMEYSDDKGATWKPVTGETIENLAQGTYQVRYAEDATHYAGPATDIAVAATAVDTAAMLIATMKSTGKRSLRATWTKVDGVDGYDVFFVNCGSGKYRLMGSVAADAERAFDFNKLDARRGYKVQVKAWVTDGSGKKYVAKSPVAHCYTSGGGWKIVNPKSLTLKKSAFTVKIGKTAQIRATIKGTRKGNILNHDHKLRYYSSDKKVAKVTSTGRIKAVGAGSCVIYVLTSNGIWKAATVTVDDRPTKIAFKGGKKTLAVGKALSLGKRVKLTPAKAVTTLTWTSSDPAVATVDENGRVTAVSKGKVTITVTTHNGKKAKIKLTIKAK